MSYSLTICPAAAADAESIAVYIGERSFEGMLRWIDAYEATQERLKRNPYEGGLAAEESRIGRGLREIFFKTPAGLRYRAVYVIDGPKSRSCGFAGMDKIASPALT